LQKTAQNKTRETREDPALASDSKSKAFSSKKDFSEAAMPRSFGASLKSFGAQLRSRAGSSRGHENTNADAADDKTDHAPPSEPSDEPSENAPEEGETLKHGDEEHLPPKKEQWSPERAEALLISADAFQFGLQFPRGAGASTFASRSGKKAGKDSADVTLPECAVHASQNAHPMCEDHELAASFYRLSALCGNRVAHATVDILELDPEGSIHRAISEEREEEEEDENEVSDKSGETTGNQQEQTMSEERGSKAETDDDGETSTNSPLSELLKLVGEDADIQLDDVTSGDFVPVVPAPIMPNVDDCDAIMQLDDPAEMWSPLGSYTRAAAALRVARCYANGTGGASIDRVAALRWFRQAAHLGHPVAFTELSRLYEKAQTEQQSIMGSVASDLADVACPSPVQRLEMLRLASARGHVAATTDQGTLLLEGLGVDCDAEFAARLFLSAATARDPVAQFKIGRCYRLGDGVPQDMEKAVRW
jgi:TPR repeat protein